MARNIKWIVIHCTASSMNAKANDLAKFFVTPEPNGRGWKRGGYHYIVEKDGSVHYMIDESQISNGVANKNSICINISYCGGVKQDANGRNVNTAIAQDTRTDAQRTALKNLVSQLKGKYPKATVVGHHYFASKACPSFDAGKEYGGIPASQKSVDYGKPYGTPKVNYAGGGYQATVSQVEQFKLAYEAVGQSLTEFPDTIVENINQLVDTYNTVVDTFAKAQQKIPITIPDPMEILNQKLENFKNAGKELKEDAKQVVENINVIPDGLEPTGPTLQDLLGKMGIIAVLKDLISPATDFIADAPAIIDASLTGVKKSVSGATQSITVNASNILEVWKSTNAEEAEASGLINKATNIIGDVGSTIGSAAGMITGTVGGITEAGIEAASGSVALAMGSVAAVSGVITKIPGVIPKIISAAMSYVGAKAAETVNNAVNMVSETVDGVIDSVGSAVDSVLTGNGNNNTNNDEPLFGDDAMEVVGYEDEPTFAEQTLLTPQTSDKVSNVFSTETKTIIGSVSLDVEEKLSKVESDDLLSNTTKSESISVLTSANTTSAESTSVLTDTNDPDALLEQFSVDNILAETAKAADAAQEQIKASMAESTKSDTPHIDSKEKELLIEQTAEETANLVKLESDFKKTFEETIHIKLYSEIRKGLMEILPDIKPDDDNKSTFVNMASFATLKIAPAVIEYIDEKFELFEEKINNYIETKLAAFAATNTGSTNTTV